MEVFNVLSGLDEKLELEKEIASNLEQMKKARKAAQAAREAGKLAVANGEDKLAETFEQRMNNAIQIYGDVSKAVQGGPVARLAYEGDDETTTGGWEQEPPEPIDVRGEE